MGRYEVAERRPTSTCTSSAQRNPAILALFLYELLRQNAGLRINGTINHLGKEKPMGQVNVIDNLERTGMLVGRHGVKQL